MNRCCICSKNIDGTSWLCHSCAKEHYLVGKKFAEWPDWVKVCHDFEWKERNRRKEKKVRGITEVSYGNIEDFVDLENSGAITVESTKELAPTEERKRCSICCEYKPLSKFKRYSKGHYAPKCNACTGRESKERITPDNGKGKTCVRCGKFRLWDEFTKNKNRSTYGYSGYCTLCKQDEKLRSLYDITLEDYNALLEKQNGVCSICEKEETALSRWGSVRSLSVDHDHETGQVRGLLCNNCNQMLGKAKDSVQILQSAIEYLSRKVVS